MRHTTAERKKAAHRPAAVVFLAGLACLAAAGCKRGPTLTTVARFDSQPASVAVAASGRVFVCFPRLSAEHGVSVAEVLPDGRVIVFPDPDLNRWAEGDDPHRRFVCVQSVYADPADPAGPLWILDAGNPQFKGVLPNAAKLIEVDLAGNRVIGTLHFDSTIAPEKSYLNDVRVDARGGFAYVTDSGLGALVVVNLKTGRCRRVLEGHASTQAESGLNVVIGGQPYRQSDGIVRQLHADGLALSGDKELLYYKALAGKTLYRIKTANLRNFSLPDSKFPAAVEPLGPTVVSDGLAMDARGDLYMTALEQNAIVRRKASGAMETVFRDDSVQWPDSMAISPAGELYFTVSQMHLSGSFNNGVDRRTRPYKLHKLSGLQGR